MRRFSVGTDDERERVAGQRTHPARVIAAALVALVSWCAPPMLGSVEAAVVVLEDGSTLEGEIVSQDDAFVLFKIKSGTITFIRKIPRDTIKRIDEDAEPAKPDPTAPERPKPAPDKPGTTSKPTLPVPRSAEPDGAKTEEASRREGDEPHVRLDLRFGLQKPLFPESIEDEGVTVEPRRRRRFVLVPGAYDPTAVGLVVSTSTYDFYVEDGKRASRKGILLMKNDARPGEPAKLSLEDRDRIWERIELKAPEEDKRGTRRSRDASEAPPQPPAEREGNQLECSNLRIPTPPDERTVRGETERVRRASKPASGFLAFLLEIPEDVKTLRYEFRHGPSATLSLEWMEQASRNLADVKGDEADQLLTGLSELIQNADRPMAELAVAKLASWRDSPSPDIAVATILRMEEALLSALGRSDPQIRHAAWNELVYGQTDFSKAATAKLLTELSPKVRDGLLAESVALLAETRTPAGDDRSRASGGRAARRDLDDSTFVPSELPTSAADGNQFHALLTFCRTADDAVVGRVVDILLADGTKQSVSLFASPSKARKIVSGKVKDISDDDLKAAVFATLLKNSDSKDLPDLASAAASITMSIDSTDHPLLDLGSRAEGQAALNALLHMLSRATIDQSVLEDQKMASLLNALVGQSEDERIQVRTVSLVLDKWKPTVRRLEREVPPKERTDRALSKFLADRLTHENEEIHLSAAKALLLAGEIDALVNGLRRASVQIKRKVLDRIGKDPLLSGDDPTFRFLAVASSELNDVAAESLVLLDRLISGLGPRRWFGHQAVKQQVQWNRINDLVGGSEAGQAAMKILRSIAATDRAKRDELEVKQDREGRRRFVQEIDQNHKTNPDGLFGCVVYADLMIPLEPADASVRAASKDDSARADLAWRWVTDQWFAIEGVSMKTEDSGVQVQFGVGRDKDPITPLFDDNEKPPEAGQIRLNVTPLLREAVKSENLRDAAWSQAAQGVDIPPDVIVTFKHHQLGTWMSEFTFAPGGQRGQSSGPQVFLGPATGRSGPFLTNVTIVLEPIPRI